MSARVDRFAAGWSDAELDRLVEVRAPAVQLGSGDPVNDGERFERAAKTVCLADLQSRALMRKLIAIAREHAESFFASDEEFVSRLNERDPWRGARLPAICFTGLPGIGKSTLLASLGRLFSTGQTAGAPGYDGLPLTAAWYLSVGDGPGLNGLLKPILWPTQARLPGANGSPAATGKTVDLPTLMTFARVRTWRDAVCYLFADEFQNISKGDATARATSLLLSLLTIGPRLCYCANFSLLHKLNDGNPEDVRRLLTNHIEMLPDGKGSSALVRYLEELKGMALDVFDFDVQECQGFIHDSTFGVKDNIVQLLKWGYVASRLRGKTAKVTLTELKAAYASREFGPIRSRVQVLWSQAIQDKEIDKRLWSPFRRPGDPFWAGDEPAPLKVDAASPKVVTATQAVEGYRRRVNDALIDAVKQPDPGLPPRKAATVAKPRARVISLTRGKQALDDLRHGADLLDDL